MSDNAQKQPFARSLNIAAEKQAKDAMSQMGRALPCSVVRVSGSIVTVKFELNSVYTLPQVTVPMFGPEWIRYPTQVGYLGVVLPIDTYLGGISGLGGGIADLSMPGNLSSLIFFPIANKNWSQSENANAVVIYGPDGVIIRSKTSDASVTVDSAGNCLAYGLRSYSWDVNGYGERITCTGGANYTKDVYSIGATVTTNTHNINPPKIPSP